MTHSDIRDPKAITGKTVLVWLLSFFGIVFSANAVFIYLALGSFPGVVVESSYEASQAFNHEIAESQAQSQRGWAVEAEVQRAVANGARVTVHALDRSGQPLTGLLVSVVLKHPTNADGDIVIPLSENRLGRYEATVPGVAAGNWNLEIFAKRDGVRVFKSDNRIFLKG